MSARGPSAAGRRVARLFRKYRGISENQRACDLDAILVEDQIELCVSQCADPGYTACLVRPLADQLGGILLAPGQSRGRVRFSIAHELGHYHIPTHQRFNGVPCGDFDMTAKHDDDAFEWEANDFAAELLMPWQLFSRDVETIDASFAEIKHLASSDMYSVSVTAVALRYTQATSNACALVCSEGGEIQWVAKSTSFNYRIPWKGDKIPPGSIANAVQNGETATERPESVDAYAWLEVEQPGKLEVFESTHQASPTLQVLSLIWAVPDDEY